MPDFSVRVSKLSKEMHCPVCGKARIIFRTYGTRSAEVRFACGGYFSTFEDSPIRPSRVCPGPGYVAALAMEQEISGGNHVS